MKFRPQRGGLDESMAEVVEISPTTEALAGQLGTKPERITVEPYVYDERICWNTHIVSIDGDAVGFTDGPIEKSGQLIECINPEHLYLGSIHYRQASCVAKSQIGCPSRLDSDESWQASEALLRVADSNEHQSKGGICR